MVKYRAKVIAEIEIAFADKVIGNRLIQLPLLALKRISIADQLQIVREPLLHSL